MANRGWLRAALVVLLAFGGGAGRAYSQVQVSIALRPADAIFIGDLAPVGTGAPSDLFDITLVKTSSTSEIITLTFTLTREQPTRSVLFTGVTKQFTLSENIRHITSSDLFSNNTAYSLDDYTIAQSAEDLRDQVMQSGRFPSGTYAFSVDARRPTGVLLGHGEARMNIGNPSRVVLVGPGAPIGMSPPTVNTSSLRFQWSPDGATAQALYRLRVTRTDGATSGEEAMQGRVAWETTTSGTSEMYPGSAAAERLEPGVTYAWQVTREVRTSSGSETIQSDIYWFRAGGSGDQTSSVSGDDAFALRMNELLKSLGLGNQLVGFKPVGVRLSDGRTVSLESLQEILAAIASGEVSLLSARVR